MTYHTRTDGLQAHKGLYGKPESQLLPLLYIAFMFALPAKALGTELYAALLLGGSFLYFLTHPEKITGYAKTWAYLSFAILFIAYAFLSYLGAFHANDRIFDQSKIMQQTAGVAIFIIVLPIFMHAAHSLCFPRISFLHAIIIALTISLSVILWQRDENIFADYGLYGAQSAGLMLQTLYFLLVLRAPHPAARALLLLAALPLLNAGTNVVIQLALVALVLTRHHGLAIALVVGLMGLVTFAFAYPPDWVAALLAADPNSLVRAQMWRNALSTIAEQPLGIGYGAAWSDETALQDAALLNAYSRDGERALEVANHSSFIDIALRLGWLGLALFIALIASQWRAAAQSPWRLSAAGILILLLISSTVNPMLESGRSALIVAFAIAYLRAAAMGAGALASTGTDSSPLQPAVRKPALSPQDKRKQLAMLDHE